MIFYDMEVFNYDWMVHFVDVTNRKETTIVNDRDKMREFYEKEKDRIWVGFNNLHYDQFILRAILLGYNLQKVNDHIINKRQSGWSYSNEFYKIRTIQYDVITGFDGLKTLEAFMGHNIKETSVDFTIDRKLTDKEIEEVIEYCKYDVEQTIEVFIRRQTEFNTRLDLINEFNLGIHNISKTNAQLSALVLGATKQLRRDEFKIDIPDTLDVNDHTDIVRWYQNPVNHDYSKKLEVDLGDVPHVFRWGGLHGARPNYMDSGNFVLVDVSSYYPSLMIEYDYHSRNIHDKQRFTDMYNERFKLKKAGDPRQEAYKLVLNTTYGCMGYEFNNLYDPRMRNNVCVSGQLLLLDLIEKFIAEDIMLIQSNTDGILLKYTDDNQLDKIKEISDEWSERTRMNLDYEYFTKIIQKDVNNYIAIGKGDQRNVYVGGWVMELHDLKYDLPVVNKALVKYFEDGTDPRVYIESENRLREFQKVVKVSRKYDYAIHNNEKIQEKTIRVFASRDMNDGIVYKYRHRDGKDQYAKFGDTSERSFIDNGDIKDKMVPDKLDKEWYIDLTYNRIKKFIS